MLDSIDYSEQALVASTERLVQLGRLRWVDVLLRSLDSAHIRPLLAASSLFYISPIANTVHSAAAVGAGPAK